MPRRRHATAALVLGALWTLLIAAPGGALASCVPPPSIEEVLETSDVVFVGTVEQTAEANRWASVTVLEVWRGPDQPQTVVVKGGPAGNAMTSVDRFFEAGVTYLFFVRLDPQEGLSDNACSSTQPFGEELAKLRPADARPPIVVQNQPGGGGLDLDSLLPFAVVGIVVAVLLGVGLLARGRAEG